MKGENLGSASMSTGIEELLRRAEETSGPASVLQHNARIIRQYKTLTYEEYGAAFTPRPLPNVTAALEPEDRFSPNRYEAAFEAVLDESRSRRRDAVDAIAGCLARIAETIRYPLREKAGADFGLYLSKVVDDGDPTQSSFNQLLNVSALIEGNQWILTIAYSSKRPGRFRCLGLQNNLESSTLAGYFDKVTFDGDSRKGYLVLQKELDKRFSASGLMRAAQHKKEAE